MGLELLMNKHADGPRSRVSSDGAMDAVFADDGGGSSVGIELQGASQNDASGDYFAGDPDVRGGDAYVVRKDRGGNPGSYPSSVVSGGRHEDDFGDGNVRQEVYSMRGDYEEPPRARRSGAAEALFDDAARRKSPEEITDLKRELLYKFDRLEKKGVRLPRKFTINSSYDDMHTEYERLKRDKEVDNSVLLQRRILMTLVSSVEFLNDRFDPFDLKLNGWSESVNDGINDYDDVFEELHDKYKGKGSMPPEIKLVMMLGGSAFMYHLTSTMFRSSQLPSPQQVFGENPGLAREFASATAATMSRQNPQHSGMASMFAGMFGGSPAGAKETSAPPPSPRMRGPGNLDSIFQMASFADVNHNKTKSGDDDDDDDDTDVGIEILSNSDTNSVASSGITRMPDAVSIMAAPPSSAAPIGGAVLDVRPLPAPPAKRRGGGGGGGKRGATAVRRGITL